MRWTPRRRNPACCASRPETGSSIELEVWALPAAAFGQFVAAIPPPLSIGTVRLADGRGVKGFIVEPTAVNGARDISAFNGWRAFMAEAATVVTRGDMAHGECEWPWRRDRFLIRDALSPQNEAAHTDTA